MKASEYKLKLDEICSQKTIKDQLRVLCKNFPRTYPGVLSTQPKFKALYKFVMQRTAKLDSSFKMSTRIFWILNDLEDFPRCIICGQPIKQNIKALDPLDHYPKYCCMTCQNRSPLKQAKDRATSLQHFGTLHPMQNESVKQQASDTYFARTGYTNPMKNPDVKAQQSLSYFERTGYWHNFSNPEVMLEREQTWLDKYGETNPNKCQCVKDKIAATNTMLYGAKCMFQTDLYAKQSRKTYRYAGYSFASEPELCYFIWLTDNHIPFEFQPTRVMTYVFDGVKHTYRADFLLTETNELIDIKGLHFFKDYDPTQVMINPFDPSKNDLYEAKHQCMIQNNVKIITEYGPYLQYVYDTYGKDYLEQYRKTTKSTSK